MDATYIQNSIEQLKTNIFMHVRHRTLLQYTGQPVLDENQLFYLLLPFLNGEKWGEMLDESIITVGIVHASLNEHEKINELHATSKEQQLTVLSGDYYSGRYYEILANSGNIPLIAELSKGIATRCEHQMKVYEPNLTIFHEWLDSLVVIESELIKQFYNVYQFAQYTSIMQNSLLILRLQKELVQYKQGKHSRFASMMMECIPHPGEPFEQVINREIEHLKSQLHEYLYSSVLQDELKIYIDRLTR